MKALLTAGLILIGSLASASVAQANEPVQVAPATYSYPTTYTVKRQAVPQRRIVRVVNNEATRAVKVNGTYMMPNAPKTETRRRVVRQTIPNLYADSSKSAMPVMFDKAAQSSR